MRALSLEQANTIIAATFAKAKKERCRPVSAIVLDAGGRVKAFQKQDGASMLRFEVCYGKAYASLALGRPSKLVLAKANEVTGDANEMDDICAIAGIHAVGLRADSDFFRDPERMRTLSIHKSAPLKDPRKPARSSGKAAAPDGRNGGRNRPGAQAAKSGP